MELNLYFAFVFASIFILASPGPTILLVISHALAHGRSIALAIVGGVIIGDLIAMSFTLIGLGVILSTSAAIFNVMKWIGALYLIWMGWKMIRSSKEASNELAEVSKKSHMTAFRDSAIVTTLNPKSIGFFIAFVPQFINTENSLAPQFIIMTLTFATLGGINAMIYALLAAKLRTTITRSDILIWVHKIGGSMLISLGLLTATLKRA